MLVAAYSDPDGLGGIESLSLCCCPLLVLLVVGGVVWWVLRGRRAAPAPPRPALLSVAPPEWRDRPAPGQIWWAEVPFTDGTGAKRRPCLVVRTGPGRVEVLKITSRDKSARRDHIRIPTRGWDGKADHDSWLDLGQVFTLADASFARHAGSLDPGSWQVVTRSHATGWYR